MIKESSIVNNRYKIISKIGSGGMGSVFLAEDLELSNQVIAVKVLETDENIDVEAFQRFKNEVVIARSLTHPSIVRTHDLGHDQGTYFITMEYVDGCTLKDLIKEKNSSQCHEKNKELLRIFLDILEGVSYAHAKGVIHRDLKPANILISKFGDVKIADFGTARSAMLTEGLTKTGFSVGTPDYMSPEQIKGEDLDQSCDIYALGILLFELITGRRPFSGDSPISVAYKQINEPLPAIQNFDQEISEQLEMALLRSTEKQKIHRIKSANEFINLLKVAPEIKDALSTVNENFSKKDNFNKNDYSENSNTSWTLGGAQQEKSIKKNIGNGLSINNNSATKIISFLIILILITLSLFLVEKVPSVLSPNETANNQQLLNSDAIPTEKKLPEPTLPVVIEDNIPEKIAIIEEKKDIKQNIQASPTQNITRKNNYEVTSFKALVDNKTIENNKVISPNSLNNGKLQLVLYSEDINKFDPKDTSLGYEITNPKLGVKSERQYFNTVSKTDKELHLEASLKISEELKKSELIRVDLIVKDTNYKSIFIKLEEAQQVETPAPTPYQQFLINNEKEIKKEEGIKAETAQTNLPPAQMAENVTSTTIAPEPTTTPAEVYDGMIEIFDSSSLTKEPRGLTLFINIENNKVSGTAKITGLDDMSVTGKIFERGIELNLFNSKLELKLVGGKRERSYRGTYTALSSKNNDNYQNTGSWSMNL